MNWANFSYTLLILFSAAITIFTLIKTKDMTLLPLLFLISGMIFFGEYLVLFIFEGYIYKVQYFKEFYENNYTGHIISNVFALPSTAAFIAGFSLKIVHILGIVCFFIGVEWIFIKLNIYEHIWWNYVFTVIALTILFTLAKKWHIYLNHPSSRWLMAFGYVCIIFCLNILMTEYLLSVVLDKICYSPGWYENPIRDNGVFYPLVGVIRAFICTAFLTFVTRRFIAVILILLSITVFYSVLWYLKILHFYGFTLLGLIILQFITISLVLIMEKYIIQSNVIYYHEKTIN